jgi:hypothetical protein
MEPFITSQRQAGGPFFHSKSPAGGTPLPPQVANAHRASHRAPLSTAAATRTALGRSRAAEVALDLARRKTGEARRNIGIGEKENNVL